MRLRAAAGAALSVVPNRGESPVSTPDRPPLTQIKISADPRLRHKSHFLPWVLIFGPIGAADELPRTVLMAAGWMINLAVAEYVIRRRGQRPTRASAGMGRATTADALAG